MTTINLPYAGIVLLVGPSNSGKTTLLQASKVVSSDQFRILVSDVEYINWNQRPKDEADALFNEYSRISDEAFAALDFILAKRCCLNKLTIVDATHLKEEDRARYLQLGKKYYLPVVAMVLNVEEK
jgi:predicted kinase